MLIEANPIEAQFFHQDPGVEVLTVATHGDVGAKMSFGQRIGQFSVYLEVVHVLRICQEIKSEHLHGDTLRLLPQKCSACLGLCTALAVDRLSRQIKPFPTTDLPRPRHSRAGGYRHDRRREWRRRSRCPWPLPASQAKVEGPERPSSSALLPSRP